MDESKVVKNEEETQKPCEKSTVRQVTLGLLTNFSNIAPSMSLGFSAVALPALTDTSKTHFLTTDQASWFASIASLATPFGCIFAGPVADRFGRKSAMYAINIICFLGWLLIASALLLPDHQYPLLLLGRLFTGLSTGLSSVPATVYMAEVSTAKLRGMFCTWATVFFSIGVLIIYFLGFVLKDNWGVMAIISAIFPCVGLCLISLFVPESPAWLVRKNRYDDAKLSLCHIFGVDHCVPEVQAELDLLIKNKGHKAEGKQKTTLEQFVGKCKHLMRPNCLKPLSLIIAFFFFQQFAGTFVIVFYAIDIVREAGIEMDAYLTIVLIGFVRLLAAMGVSYVSKMYGRRPLSLISGSGMTLTMITLAAYILMIKQGKIGDDLQEKLMFLPLILMLLYFVTSTLGFLPMPFAMAAEIFPAKIRGTATGLGSGIGYFFNFITVKIFANMVGGMGMYGVFFFYGSVSLVGTLFVFVFLPETKGKSLQEIEEHFQAKPGKRSSLLKNDLV